MEIYFLPLGWWCPQLQIWQRQKLTLVLNKVKVGGFGKFSKAASLLRESPKKRMQTLQEAPPPRTLPCKLAVLALKSVSDHLDEWK